jgi:hypothetical protein
MTSREMGEPAWRSRSNNSTHASAAADGRASARVERGAQDGAPRPPMTKMGMQANIMLPRGCGRRAEAARSRGDRL